MSFGSILPLRKPSELCQSRIRKRILSLTEGVMVRICRLLEAAASDAIQSERECIEADLLTDALAAHARWCQSPSAARGEPLREEDVILELIVPRCLPVAPRPVAGELLSSWIERIAAANAITGAELLKSVTDCLSMERQHALLDYCLAPTLRCALAIAGRVSDLDVQALNNAEAI